MSEQVTTPAGLVVPKTAVNRRRRTMPVGTFKRLTRFVREMKPEGVAVLLACPDCKGPLKLTIMDRLVDLEFGGRPVLDCACTTWAVR